MGLGLISPTALKVLGWRSNSPRGLCVPRVPHGRRPDAGSGVRVGVPVRVSFGLPFLFVSGRATASFLPSDNGEFRKH
jgi:hypothetical protein